MDDADDGGGFDIKKLSEKKTNNPEKLRQRKHFAYFQTTRHATLTRRSGCRTTHEQGLGSSLPGDSECVVKQKALLTNILLL
ncbi:hypothetical protein L798_10416 [Zootermopsis nevadensis]|uniref:Uncharacterized protein n=1 Tax=Zootermopsis nevadensis TaxID=136037 RepID=A0A067QY85_ZOONE|nr:hypothetical protein L798_10416 [Zootermopsis nevadensis]